MLAWLLVATLLAGAACWYCGQREHEQEVCQFGWILVAVSLGSLVLRWWLLQR